MGRKKHANKRVKRYVGEDDRISRLPDDILVDILSLLSLKEAVGTSVLSSRWMNLWEHTTCLDLDGDRALDKILRNYKTRDKLINSKGLTKYVSWVNRILQSHKAPALKEFRIGIHFILDIEAKKSITQWLEFAFARHVQRLELDLTIHESMTHHHYMNYKNNCFPEELLTASSSDSLCIHHPPNFKSLRALLFTSVDVTDRAIDFFLNNCPLLEKLVFRHCRTLSNVEVCGSSLVLQHLEIDSCYHMKSLKVSAPRLTYLMVLETLGSKSALLLGNAPMLVEIYVTCAGHNIQLRHLFSTLSTRTSQLEILRLVVLRLTGKIGKLPELPKLKKLSIELEVPNPECLVRMADLIMACPCLEEFVLENEWGKYFLESEDGVGAVDDAIKSPHHHLKVMKYCGYYGMASDVQLVSYILENCVALQKLIIDPAISKSRRLSIGSAEYKLKYEKTGRENAKQQLGALVPRHIELVIL